MKHRFYCSYKKIIFYNTSINALLKHEEKMLAEMQDKRHFIKNQRNAICSIVYRKTNYILRLFYEEISLNYYKK